MTQEHELWKIVGWELALPDGWYKWTQGDRTEIDVAASAMARTNAKTDEKGWRKICREYDGERAPYVQEVALWLPQEDAMVERPANPWADIETSLGAGDKEGKPASPEEWIAKLEAAEPTLEEDNYVYDNHEIEVMEKGQFIFVRELAHRRITIPSEGIKDLEQLYCGIAIYIENCTDALLISGQPINKDLNDLFLEQISEIAMNTVFQLEPIS